MPYAEIADMTTIEIDPDIGTMNNPCCILTTDNNVMFMSNLIVSSYANLTNLFILPESMCPHTEIKMIPVAASNARDVDGNIQTIIPLLIDTNGCVYLLNDLTNCTIYLNGITFNVCDRYYNADIGNNFLQGTSFTG